MAAEQAPRRHPEAAKQAVNFDGFRRVPRTGRLETASRAQKRRNAKLIRAYQPNGDRFHWRHFTARARIWPTMEWRPLLRVGLK